MPFLENVLGKREEVDIEEFLNTLDDDDQTLYEDADAYVKPISLQGEEDTTMAIEELKKGNFILLNIGDLSKRNAIKLRDLVGAIRSSVNEIDGDIARISHDRVLVTPSKVKIVKRRENR